jgi:pimeloyl-ACP methyl ester carboxylesterase
MRQSLRTVVLASVVVATPILALAQAPAQTPARPAAPAAPLAINQQDGSFTTSDGIKIHYITAGTGGSWVVLIHGYSDSAQRMWFNTGIAQEIAKTHRVVALDNRNHGQSDKPQPGGSGKALDVVELMDHLHIQKAHIHGYSMGGGMVGQLLGMIPDRFITAGFGGSGMTETDPELRSKAAALDEAMPKATGDDAAAMDRFRARVAAARPGGAAPAAGAAPATGAAATEARGAGAGRGAGTASASRGAAAPAGTPTAGSSVDISKLSIPIMAVNGSFDNPYSKSLRLWREAKIFENVILPGRTHLTAIGVGAKTPQLYIDSIASFINTYDEKDAK